LQAASATTTLPANAVLSGFFQRLATDKPDAASKPVLLLDYDGTLAPFHLDRHRAFPYAEVVPVLQKIIESGTTRVVVVSGRPVVELKALLTSFNAIEAWGSHGLEHMLPDGTYRQIDIDRKSVALLAQAEQWVSAAGLVSHAEFKPGGIAIHWRGMPETEVLRIAARARHGWTPLAEHPELKLLEFEAGLELRVAHPDKGDAVDAILRVTTPGTQIAYLGDDLTDEDAFRALNGRGLTVLVRHEPRETSASVWLKPPQELIRFLEQWLASVSA
jgi:trehalose 6-phosphate phosphatase